MKLKLNENLCSIRVVSMLRLAGHDVATVREQNLALHSCGMLSANSQRKFSYDWS